MKPPNQTNLQGFDPIKAVISSEAFLLALAGVIASALVATFADFGQYQAEIAALVFVVFGVLAGIREARDAYRVIWRSRRFIVWFTQQMFDAFEQRTGRDIDDRAEQYLIAMLSKALDDLDPTTGGGSVLDQTHKPDG
jgi:hypothetical protein